MHRCTKTGCSLIQNVTVKVSFLKSEFLRTPQAPPPTFLFLLIFNCQITDRPKSRHKINAPNFRPEQQTSIPPIRLISLERKSSSPAAPPPSFSEWAYNPTPPKQSTGVFRKNHLSCIQLFFQRSLHGSSNLACFPDCNRLWEPRKT